jgi:hypothetical protein
MASQSVVDTYCDELLYAFYKLGGFVDLYGINILMKTARMRAIISALRLIQIITQKQATISA